MKKLIGLALAVTVLATSGITAYAVTDRDYCPQYGSCAQPQNCGYYHCQEGADCMDEDCPEHCEYAGEGCGRASDRGHHREPGTHHRSGSGHRRGC